ncbi:MAG: hypothetical protein EP329_19760 [Deltaproteobacteria bacterium]|nr:MAG: hypothetical protein EP329_19760 [Deltaproteobacteria bacterium]
MLRPSSLLAALALTAVTLLACGSSPATVAPPAPGGCVVAALEAPAAAVGDWVTTDRWEIQLQLLADGTVYQHDRISPCPPNARCIWSGVATNAGRWALDGDTITLTWPRPDTTHDVTLVTTLKVHRCGDRLELVDGGGRRFRSGTGG